MFFLFSCFFLDYVNNIMNDKRKETTLERSISTKVARE